ncbi:hypothetical protein AB0L40_09990 [Patulibacter sp. NPDC049589]|uniref:hypothetical protein n=1 Tax=Patulibacter sp. NPDC049589 TaxID=3154731 RepID=UPI00343828D7
MPHPPRARPSTEPDRPLRPRSARPRAAAAVDDPAATTARVAATATSGAAVVGATLAGLLALGAGPAAADVLEVQTTGKVQDTRLGITETFRATAIAADGSRRPLPDFVVGGSGQVSAATTSPDGTLVAVDFEGGHQGTTVLRTDGGAAPRPVLFSPLEAGFLRTWSADGRRLLFDPVREGQDDASDSDDVPPRTVGVCDLQRARCRARPAAGAAAAFLPDGRLVSATTAIEGRLTFDDLEDTPEVAARGGRDARRMRRIARRRIVVRTTVAGATSTATVDRHASTPASGVDVATGAVASPVGVLVSRQRVRVRRGTRARCRVYRESGVGLVRARRCLTLTTRRRPAAPLLVAPDGAVRTLHLPTVGADDVTPVRGLPDGRWLGLLGADEPAPISPSTGAAIAVVGPDGTAAPVTLGGRRATAERIATAVGRRPGGRPGEVELLGYERATGTIVVLVGVEPAPGTEEDEPRAAVRLRLDGGPAQLIAVQDEGYAGEESSREVVAAW